MKSPRSGVNRRDLLRLRRMQGRMADSGSALPERPTAHATDLLRVHRGGMGSFFEIRMGAQVPGGLDLANRALDVIEALETQLTVYQDDSEVSRLNATAHLEPVAAEPGLFALLQRAVELSRLTGGAYDVTSGALSEAWGFVRGPKRVPDPEVLADAQARTGWHHLRLDPENGTVAFDRPGIRINLGSIGKGYAIDRAVSVIRNHFFPVSALVHGGQSSLYALGSPPGRFGDRWEIAVRNPARPEAPLGVLRLRNCGLGTSGGAFQSFVEGGKVYGHILDPRTGEPATGPASVTVLAPTAADADALSTAFFLMGPEAARSYVAAHPDVGILFVESDHSEGGLKVLTFGLRSEDFLIGENSVNSIR
ncbi:MAG: FAD:protein FMN transferase [Isosphaeraceae bacterium]